MPTPEQPSSRAGGALVPLADERWIAAPRSSTRPSPRAADGAKLAGAVAELRLDLGPAHVARGHRGPRRPRRLRGGPAGRRRATRYGARRRASAAGRHLRRDHAVLGRD